MLNRLALHSNSTIETLISVTDLAGCVLDALYQEIVLMQLLVDARTRGAQ